MKIPTIRGPEDPAALPDPLAVRPAEKTPLERAAHGTAWLTAAHAALTVGGYVVAVILARDLGPVRYGVYGIVYSVLLGVELMGRLGIPQALSRLIAERGDEARDLEATGITLTVLIHLPLFLVFWIAAPWLGEIFNVENGARMFRFAAIDVPFFGLYFTASNILNGRRDYAGQSLAISLYACSKVVGIVILAATRVTVEWALLVNAGASIVTLAFLVMRVGLPSIRPRLGHASTVIRLACLLGVFSLSAQILSGIDLWALNALGGDIPARVKGLYVGATNLARIGNVMAFVMTAVLIPTMAEALSRGDVSQVRRSARVVGRLLIVSLLPMAAIVAGNAGDLMAFVYSEPYRAGAPFLAVLVVSHGVLFTMYIALASMLIGISFEAEASLISLAIVPFAAFLDYLLIEVFGAAGAPLAAIIALSTVATAVAGRVRQHLGEILTWFTLWRALALSTLAWTVSVMIDARGVWLLLELAAVSAGYVLLAFLTDLIRAEDLELFRSRRGIGGR